MQDLQVHAVPQPGPQVTQQEMTPSHKLGPSRPLEKANVHELTDVGVAWLDEKDYGGNLSNIDRCEDVISCATSSVATSSTSFCCGLVS